VTARFIVIQPAPATAAEEAAAELAGALAARGSVLRVSAMDGLGVDDLAHGPAAALDALARRISVLEADAVLIDQVEDLPLSTFDVFGWNLDVAASTGASILLALDVEGIPPELVAQDVRVAGARAVDRRTSIAAVLLPGAAHARVDTGGIPLLSLPPTPDDLASLLG